MFASLFLANNINAGPDGGTVGKTTALEAVKVIVLVARSNDKTVPTTCKTLLESLVSIISPGCNETFISPLTIITVYGGSCLSTLPIPITLNSRVSISATLVKVNSVPAARVCALEMVIVILSAAILVTVTTFEIPVPVTVSPTDIFVLGAAITIVLLLVIAPFNSARKKVPSPVM